MSGLPDDVHTRTQVWLLGIAHPHGGPASNGPVAPLGHPTPHAVMHQINYAAEVVDAITGEWIESESGYDPHYDPR